MKRQLILSIIACGASLVLCQALHAQDASPAASAAAAGGGGQGGGRRGGGMTVDRLTQQLNLTTDQQTQAKPIVDTYNTATQAVRADTSLSRTDRMSKMKDARDAMTTSLNAILTPDQQTKWAAYVTQMQNRRRGGGGGGGGGGGAGGGASPAPSTSGS